MLNIHVFDFFVLHVCFAPGTKIHSSYLPDFKAHIKDHKTSFGCLTITPHNVLCTLGLVSSCLVLVIVCVFVLIATWAPRAEQVNKIHKRLDEQCFYLYNR